MVELPLDRCIWQPLQKDEETIMCVALPGKVIEVREKSAVVDFNGNQVTARTGLVDIQVNDYVLVHAGCVIQKVTPQDAADLTDLMNDVKAFE